MDRAARDPSPLETPETTAGRRLAEQARPAAQTALPGTQAARRTLPPAAPQPAPCQTGHLPAVHEEPVPDIRILALAYPEFTMGQSVRGRHGPAWTVIRKDPAQPGLYAVVTPNLAELRDILASYAAQHADASDPGT